MLPKQTFSINQGHAIFKHSSFRLGTANTFSLNVPSLVLSKSLKHAFWTTGPNCSNMINFPSPVLWALPRLSFHRQCIAVQLPYFEQVASTFCKGRNRLVIGNHPWLTFRPAIHNSNLTKAPPPFITHRTGLTPVRGGDRCQLAPTTGGAQNLVMVRHNRDSKDKQVEIDNLSLRTGARHFGLRSHPQFQNRLKTLI